MTGDYAQSVSDRVGACPFKLRIDRRFLLCLDPGVQKSVLDRFFTGT
jgi:hypothetical protein